MRPWELKWRGSCLQGWKPCTFLPPRFYMKSKCNAHTPSSSSPHFSLQAPPRRGVFPGYTSLLPTSPRQVCLWSLRTPLTGGCPSSPVPLERAAGGAHGLPQLPARGDSSEHLVHFDLAEDLQELEPWEEAGRAECVHVKGAARPWLRGLWTCGVSSAPSRV